MERYVLVGGLVENAGTEFAFANADDGELNGKGDTKSIFWHLASW